MPDFIMHTEQDVTFSKSETIDQAIADVVQHYPGVTGKVAIENGPGSGWPVVRFSSPKEDELISLLIDFFEYSKAEAEQELFES